MLLILRKNISEKLSMLCGPKCYNNNSCDQGIMTCGKIKEISKIYSNKLLEGLKELTKWIYYIYLGIENIV